MSEAFMLNYYDNTTTKKYTPVYVSMKRLGDQASNLRITEFVNLFTIIISTARFSYIYYQLKAEAIIYST